MGTVTLVMLMGLVVPVGWCQVDNSNPIQGGPFYLDSNADCNGPIREMYGQTTQVLGHGAIQEAQSPTSCTLTLRSTSNFDKTNLHVQVVAATIRDCYVRLTIWDGEPGQGTLRAYDCNTQNRPNERDLVTTGDTVSFTLERRDSTNMLYDIEIFVTPINSGTGPGYENDYGQDFGFFREKLEGEEVVAIVASAFALVVIICVALFICCYRKYKGSNKPWETYQLSTFQPEPPPYESKSKMAMSDTSSGVWASNMSRGASQVSRQRVPPQSRLARPSEDVESVFSDDVPPKQRLMEQERQRQREQQRREMERERARGRGRPGRGFASQNDSFVQADDDHPQDTFVERIIEPRVRPSRIQKPPSYEEAISDSETEKSEVVDDEESEEEDDVDHKSSSEEEPDSEQESEQESEEEEEEEETKAAAPKPARRRPQAQPPAPPGAAPVQPGMQPPGVQPHPAYPGYPRVPYMGAYPMPPGQYVPVMAGPGANQFRPVVAGPGFPPPNYPGEQLRPVQQIKPTDPPVYSYLVQRGYTPMEGRQSPVSSANTSHSNVGHTSDDPDANILTSGVEYMRR